MIAKQANIVLPHWLNRKRAKLAGNEYSVTVISYHSLLPLLFWSRFCRYSYLLLIANHSNVAASGSVTLNASQIVKKRKYSEDGEGLTETSVVVVPGRFA